MEESFFLFRAARVYLAKYRVGALLKKEVKRLEKQTK